MTRRTHRLPPTVLLTATLLVGCTGAPEGVPATEVAAEAASDAAVEPDQAAPTLDRTTRRDTDAAAARLGTEVLPGVVVGHDLLGSVHEHDPERDGAEPLEPACDAMAELRGQVAELESTHDPATLAPLMRARASTLDELSSVLATLGMPRDAERSQVVENAAGYHRDVADQLERVAAGGAADPGFLASMEEDLTWWETIWLDLVFWQARSCPDVPGVTHGETNGIPSVHVDLGAPTDTSDDG